MRSSDSNQKIQELFLVSSVSVLAIVCSFPLWFTFVDPPGHHRVCRLSQVSSQARAPLYPGGVGTLVAVISASKSLTLSQKCYVLCVRLRLWTEGFIESVSFQPSAELEVACRSEFLLDVVELSQRVPNFDESGLWIGQSAL